MKSPSEKMCVPFLESHIGYWLRLVSNQISGAFARALQERQLSVAEWVALNQIQHRADITAIDLADLMGMTRGAISKVLDKLESKNLVRRKASHHDSRVCLLSLTPSGRRSLPDLKDLADNNDRYFFAPLDPEERAMLRSLMEKLAKAHQMCRPPVD
ncbi:MAG TPA: MarR family transcriptional regulator [Rhodanobacter sp.]|nr:MarR family transcriptional regulator [Rhodanobacter sp.]